MDISNAWGYGAVAIPSMTFYQGFVIDDPATLHDDIAAFYWAVQSVYPDTDKALDKEHFYIGSIQAALVETLIHFTEADAACRVRVLAAALSGRVGRYWLVSARRDELGTASKLIKLKATTPERAREMIDRICAPIRVQSAIDLQTKTRH